MNELKLAQDSLKLVRKDIGLEEDIDLSLADDPFELLHEFLCMKIQYLIDQDFG